MSNDSVNDSARAAASIYERERLTMSGRDRLYKMFTVDEVGSFSYELTSSAQAAVFGAFVGGVCGGLFTTKTTDTDATTQKQSPRLKSGLYTKPISEDGFSINFFRGAIRWGWRIGLFCGSLMLMSTATSVYRGKSGVLEYVLAGGVLGSACTANLGAKAMAVGGCVGTGVGAVGGCLVFALQKVGSTTTEEARFWQYGWKNAQLKHTMQEARQLREESRRLVKKELEKELNVQRDILPVTSSDH